jgi:polysaccharide biosynthesis protein PslH
MVCTNPVFRYESGGTKWVLDSLIKLCSCHNDVVFFTASYPEDKALLHGNEKGSSNTYYFRQGMFLEEYLHILTDLNICFLLNLRKVIKKEHVDLLWITMPYGIVLSSIFCRNVPIIYDSHAVVSDAVGITLTTLEHRSRVFRMPILRSIVRLTLQGYISFIERLACRRATHIKAISEPDRSRFIAKYGISKDKITTISPFIDSSKIGKAPSESQRLPGASTIKVIFHGGYNHRPNRDAYELILNYIAPEVVKHNGNIQFLLAGAGMPVFERGNVKSLGFVEDIQTLVASADIAIVPLMEGEGAKIKIFDYMAAGLPIISTKKGIQAIEAENGKHALIYDDIDQKFISAILGLANDSERREVLGRNTLELVKTKYNQDIVQTQIDEMLAKVVELKSPRNIRK